MKKILFIIIPCLGLFATSCQKGFEITDDGIDTTGNTGGTGGTGGGSTTNPPVANTSYQPLTVGSFWKYKDSATGIVSTETVSNISKSYNSLSYTYSSISPSSGADSMFRLANGSNYHFLTIASAGTGGGTAATINLFYLDTTKNVGQTWAANAGTANGFNATSETKVIAKNITLTVEGKTYSNVIHTQVSLSYDLPVVGSTKYTDYDIYSARGIGIIRTRAVIYNMGTVILTTKRDLTDYQIK